MTSQEWWGEDIAVSDPGNAANLRGAIQTYIWGDSGWTRHSPIDVQKNVNLPTDVKEENIELPHLRSADRLTIHLRHGFTSVVYILHPLKSNRLQVPVIYHSGHQIVFFHEDRHTNDSGAYAISVLDFFLDKGFDVIGISMPLVGYNYHPLEVKENGQVFPITCHDDVFQLENPFYYFLEPIRATIDFLSSEEGYKRFIMMGLSGGGWSTTVYSAIDERVWLSFPVAGSIPNAMRVSPRDVGDKEQYLADFYNRFNYPTLYTLAAEGPGRLSCQILNEKDECCFAFNGDNYWVPDVQLRLAQMHEPGQFHFFFDRCAPFHKVSAAATNKIYEEIKEAFAGKATASRP
ncbi:MAG TPA: hypothetical protein VGM89_05745 [Puia sp.]